MLQFLKKHLSEKMEFYDLFQIDGQNCSYLNDCHGSNFIVTSNLKVTSAGNAILRTSVGEKRWQKGMKVMTEGVIFGQ